MASESERPFSVLSRGRNRTSDVEGELRETVAPRWRRKWLVIVLSLVILGGVVGLLLPAMNRPTGCRRRPKCKSSLRNIGLGCQLYADENDGAFPDSLMQLVPKYIDNPKIFSCPSSPSNWEDFNSGNVTEYSSSYRLIPGMRADMPSTFILAYDKAQNHGGVGGNAVFVDGHVEWLRSGEFAARIEKQRKEVREFLEAAAE